MKNQATRLSSQGLTLIELMIVLGILAILFTLTTINITSLIPRANVTTTVDTLIADLKLQQARSMLGEMGTATDSAQIFGVHFDSNQYVLYAGATYSASSASNSAIVMPNTVQLSTTFPSGNILFSRGSGEIVNYASSSSTITVSDSVLNLQRTIQLNRFGVITGVN